MPTPQARLIIVGGPPGSGKSTLARRLSGSLDAVRLEPDAWIADLALDPLDSDARDRVETLQRRLAGQLLDRGLTVVLDWGAFSRDKRDALRELARHHGAAAELHFLDAPAEELRRRLHERDDERAPSRDQLDAMLADVQAPDADELALYDVPACAGRPAGLTRPACPAGEPG